MEIRILVKFYQISRAIQTVIETDDIDNKYSD